MSVNDQLEPTVFAIFGGTGDLAWRKLVPALFDLSRDRSLPPHFSVIVLGRGKLAEDKLRRHLRDGLRSIFHTDFRSTCAKLASFGLQIEEGVIHETS
jgi:glucose-6-phosphate 1-dehydrogenase